MSTVNVKKCKYIFINTLIHLCLTFQVHPATMLGWYDHDRKRNNGMTVHFPLVLKAYFKCIEIKVCYGNPQTGASSLFYLRRSDIHCRSLGSYL